MSQGIVTQAADLVCGGDVIREQKTVLMASKNKICGPMSNLKIPVVISVMVISSMCTRSQKESIVDIESKVNLLISSNEPDSLIEAFSIVGDNKMEKYVPRIFEHIDDPRISHHLHLKGLSVYQSKVFALRKISGLDPPCKITYKPDTLVINFYFEWAKEAGFDLAERPG